MIPEQGNEIHQGTSCPPKLLDQYYFHQNLQPEKSTPNVITLKYVAADGKSDGLIYNLIGACSKTSSVNRNKGNKVSKEDMYTGIYLKNPVELVGGIVVKKKGQPRSYCSN